MLFLLIKSIGLSCFAEHVMADKENKRPKTKRWIAFFIVPAVYVLSYAPVLSLIDAVDKRNLVSYQTEEKLWSLWWTIYAPVNWLAHRSKWFSDLLGWYIDLF